MLWLFLLFIVAPLLELYVIIQVASVIGGWETIALLIVESVIGAWLLKRQGLTALGRISQALDAGRLPGKELVDGFLLMLAGALMLAPGFIGDLLAYLLMLPPTRAPFRALALRRMRKGQFGRFFAATTSADGTTRFVGTFRAGGGSFFDTTGGPGATRQPPSGELGP